MSEKFEVELAYHLEESKNNFWALLLLFTPEKLDLIAQILETARESDCLKLAELLQKLDEV